MIERRGLLSAAAAGGIGSSALGLLTGRVRGDEAEGPFEDHDSTSGQRPERVRRVEPDPDDGFNHPYLLATPARFREGAVPLLVEMNNADETLTREEEVKRAMGQIRGLSANGAWLSEALGVPHLKPIFPENPGEDSIEETHEISLLDRSTMTLDGTDLDRVDLQLLRMADHARERILSNELADVTDSTLNEQFIVYGNSSEGTFAERLAAMHPEEVLAIAGAGLNGIALLPLDELGGRSLNYHVGVADLESITGEPYDASAHDDVDLLLIQGGSDTVNRLMMDKEEAMRRNNWKGDEALYDTARMAYGPRMVKDRFPRCQIAFERAGVSAQFRVIPGMSHDDSMALHHVAEFFRRSIEGEDVSEFGQRFRLPLDRTIELRTADPAVGDELQFVISGAYPPPEGLLTYEWHVDDGRSSAGQAATFTFEDSGAYEVSLAMETAHGQSGQLGMNLLGDGSSFAALQYAVDPPGPRHLAEGTEVEIDESTTYAVDVTNVGAARGERRIEFMVGGRTVASEAVQLDPSSSTTVTFEHTFEEAGDVDVRIPPAYSQTMTVTEPSADATTAELPDYQPTASTEQPGSGSPGQPGLGILATLAGIGSAITYAVYRNDPED